MIVCRLLYQQLFPQNPLGIIQVLPWQCGCQGPKGCLKAQVGVLLLDFNRVQPCLAWQYEHPLSQPASCDFLNPLALRLELSSEGLIFKNSVCASTSQWIRLLLSPPRKGNQCAEILPNSNTLPQEGRACTCTSFARVWMCARVEARS